MENNRADLSTGKRYAKLMQVASQKIAHLQAELDELKAAQHEPIALIGMGCRFPGGVETPDAFWSLLRNGIDAITEIPPDRWDVEAYYSPERADATRMYTRHIGAIDQVDHFDPQFFGISPREAEQMDPQQRLLLTVSWEALEHAGIAPETLRLSATGAFIGLTMDDYARLQPWDASQPFNHHSILGLMPSVAAGRIAYILGLQGPAVHLDTACSSSLVALHLACQSLRSGESTLALVGGVNLILSPQAMVGLCGLNALSPDGHCHTFDAAANGYVRGEGCAVVVLKRLSAAVQEGDRILAVIRGSAVNHDGPSSRLSAPNQQAQEKLLRQALQNAQIRPDEVQYVEAHGTGTPLGDPIEISALQSVYGRAVDPLIVGSVKTNIGHLEAAAGLAGLIKVALAMQHGEIPPHLHFHNPTPQFDWENSAIQISTSVTPWPSGKRIAGVSAFGLSGANAHIILEEAPPLAPPVNPVERSQSLLTLSAKSQPALRTVAARYAEFLTSQPDVVLEDLCYTANSGRNHFAHRLCVSAVSVAQLQAQLAAFTQGETVSSIMQGHAPAHQAPPQIAFLFTGQGAQYVNMGRELYETQPVFRRTLARCAEILQPYLEVPLLDVLFPTVSHVAPTNGHSPTGSHTGSHAGSHTANQPLLDETAYSQPAIFALEYALATLWQSWGIEPDMVMGHSLGEYVAACVAGVFSLEDGLKLVAARGRLMQALPQNGDMVAVMTPDATGASAETQVQQVIASYNADAGPVDVTIAAVNGPQNVVISGRREALHEIMQTLAAVGIKTRKLVVSHAFHSPLMEPMLAAFHQVAATITYHQPKLRFVSNMTGKLVGQEIATPDYWVRHVREAVCFADGVMTLQEQGCTILLEIGPQPVLLGMAQTILDTDTHSAKQVQSQARNPKIYLPSLRENQSAWQQMLASLGEMYVRGVAVDWPGFDKPYQRRKVVLPTYPFQLRRYWIETTSANPTPATPSSHLLRLIAAGDVEQLQQHLLATGQLAPHLQAALPAFAQLLVDQHRRHQAESQANTVGDFYNKLAAETAANPRQLFDVESFLTFGIFAEKVPGFSWIAALTSAPHPADQLALVRRGQEELRALLYAPVDFTTCRTVMDIGCGYGTDLIALAEQHAHLKLAGYTIAREQAKLGQQQVEKRGLGARINIFCRNSVTDPWPQSNDLIIGTEVACHIKDKAALFANIRDHLNPGGMVVLADFVSYTGFAIEHEETASFLATAEEWLELFARNGLKLIQYIDLSREIANFLDDPDFDEHVAALVNESAIDNSIYAALASYNKQQKLMRQGLLGYGIFAAQQQDELSDADLEAWNRSLLASPTTYAEITPQQWLYDVQWPAAPLPTTTDSLPVEGNWLIFADQQGIGARLAAQLEGRGGHAILLWPGEALEQIAGGWRINPLSTSELRQLLQGALAADQALNGVIHLWSLDAPRDEPITIQALEDAQRLGCGSTLSLVQTLAQTDHAPRLWLVTQNALAVGGATPCIAQSPLWGLAGTVAQEQPDLHCVRIDLDESTPADAADLLLHELLAADKVDRIAYRTGVRYAAQLGRFVAQAKAKNGLVVRADRSYLITGGTGGLGLQVAQWLAEQGARHLVLTSRRGATSPAAQATIRNLEATGVQLAVIQADVAEAADVARLLQTIEENLPPLCGILHAAGVADYANLAEQQWDSFQRVMAPKLQGSWHLHALTQTLPLDFFVFFSSASALVDTGGLGSYAAANAFMDGLTHYRRAVGLPAMSINWGPWAEVGMALTFARAGSPEVFSRNSGMGVIEPAIGVQLLATLLTQAVTQVAVLPINWLRYRHLAPAYATSHFFGQFMTAAPASILTQQQQALRTTLTAASPGEGLAQITAYLVDQVAHILRLQAAPLPQERLIDIGMDSLMAIELHNRIQAALGVDVAVTTFLEDVSIEGLANIVSAQLSEQALTSFKHDSPRSQAGNVKTTPGDSRGECDHAVTKQAKIIEGTL